MAIYRFKIFFEDDEEIIRVIEIKSNQTMEDLHFAILRSVEFDTKHNAYFYISDDHWKKGEQFVFLPRKEEDEMILFNQKKLSSVINDPHQKLLYIYDLEKEWSFLIELVGISIKEDPKVTYPVCVKTESKPPKQYNITRKVGAELEEDEFDYLTKNLLAGEIAEDMTEHFDAEEDGEEVESEEGEETAGGEENESEDDNIAPLFGDDTEDYH